MRIYSLRISERAGGPNFGDQLNEWLWPKEFDTSMSDVDHDTTVYAIGTILGAHKPFPGKALIFGAGAGYWGTPEPDPDRDVWFVRGPHTAKLLGGDTISITDPAYLIANHVKRAEKPEVDVAVMPRYDAKWDGGDLFPTIPAQGPPDQVLGAISRTGLLLTETLHGAVCADALRIPWIPIRTSHTHDFKWRDWCKSLNMVYCPIEFPERDLVWAVKYGIPQLSANSIHRTRLGQLRDMVGSFNRQFEDYMCDFCRDVH